MAQAESERMSIVGERIKTLREKRGWSRGELARRANNMAPQTVMRIEEGDTPQPTQKTVERIARALGVPYAQLWGTQPLGAQDPGVEYNVERVAAPGLDVELLTNVLEATSDFFDAHHLQPTSRRRAEIAAYLYGHFLLHGPMDDRAFVNFMSLVLQK